jgi:hypothetical protein
MVVPGRHPQRGSVLGTWLLASFSTNVSELNIPVVAFRNLPNVDQRKKYAGILFHLSQQRTFKQFTRWGDRWKSIEFENLQ